MSTTLTPTHRPLLHRAQRLLRICWLRWEISSAERWIMDCERDQILESDTLTSVRWRVQELRVQLAIAEAL